MSMIETFNGFVETTQDALLIFEACRRNILPKIARRLLEKERKLVRSGSVFVFDQKESGIKRWTDGLVWSPSRILGNFLIYRELDKTQSKRSHIKRPPYNVEEAKQRTKERQLVGSLSEAYHFRKDGLIKKTISLVLDGNPLHLISYYHPDDVLDHRLRTPSAVPELVNLEISPDLLNIQNFRIPPMIEPEQPYTNDTDASIPRYHPSADKRFNRLEQKDALQAMHNALPSPTSTPNTPLPSNERKYDPKSIHSLLISPSNEDRIPQHHGLISDTSRMFNPVIQWNAM